MGSIGPIITASAAKLHLSPTLEVNEIVQEVSGAGKEVIHLGFGEATLPVQSDVLECHRNACGSTSYMPVAGLQELREKIASYQSNRLGVPIDAAQVVVAPGSKPLLFALFDILDGDVLLPRPSWVSYEQQVSHSQKRLHWIETDEHDRHSMTEEGLNSAYISAIKSGANPRIMLINSPSNPTGHIFSSDQVACIVSFCAKKSITLISDEIYSDICFDAKDVSASAFRHHLDISSTVIMTGGLSKTYSVGGWRIGYAVFPNSVAGKSIQQTVLAYASECWSAASAPSQIAAALALSTASTTNLPIGKAMDDYRASVRCFHRLSTKQLYRTLKECGLEVAEPQGAFYLYPSFRPYAAQLQERGIYTSKALSEWLVKNYGLATLPGSAFGEKNEQESLDGGSYRLRMATSCLYFSTEEERYREGIDMLSAAAAGKDVYLPLLEKAMDRIRRVIEELKS